MANFNKKTLNSIKALAYDMTNKDDFNYNYLIDSANALYVLYSEKLNVISSNSNWANRDRLIISSSIFTPSLYSTLYFAGYNYSLDDLHRFCEVDSFTPNHSLLNVQMGIEATTGLAGEGISNAVGIALGERYLESLSKSYNKKTNIVDFYTYVLTSDEDMQSGLSFESLSYAGKQKLNKLIVLYYILNENSKDITDEYESLGFEVIETKNTLSGISSAIEEAKNNDYPSLIIIKSTKASCEKLSNEEILEFKKQNKLSLDPFKYDEKLKEEFIKNNFARITKKYAKWQKSVDEIKQNESDKLNDIINLLENGDTKISFDPANFQINEKYNESMIVSNEKAINFIASKTPFMLGIRAGKLNISKGKINNSDIMNYNNPLARNIDIGYRTSSLGAIANGLALLNLKVYTIGELIYSDYLKSSIRLAALMNLPVIYSFTHDTVFTGYDGPVLEPVEQLSALRLIPNLTVLRPCDIYEVMGSWDIAIKSSNPSAIVITNEKMGITKHTNPSYVKYGAYIIRKEKEFLDGIIVATGSEVKLANEIAEKLYEEKIDVRVVTMPSVNLFLNQNPIYEEKLLPKNIKTCILEAGSSALWNRFTANKEMIFGINNFGESGKPSDVQKLMNYDFALIYSKIKKMFESE